MVDPLAPLSLENNSVQLGNDLIGRIFHTHRDEEVAKVDGARQATVLGSDLSSPYRSSQNRRLTQHPSAFPASTVDGHEISGLGAAPDSAAYKVSLDVFEGPLDLLLYLIKKDEVDIYDISIERVTKQYLAYIEAFEVLNIEVAGEFVVMAANLLYIKSRTLLPKDQQMPEEDVEEDDPRWELIRQLIEYKKFKEAALHLRDREELQSKLFARPEPLSKTLSTPPDTNLLLSEVSIFDLINAFQKAVLRLSEKEPSREIYEENFTVADRMQHLVRILEQGVSMKFEELFASSTTRTELVVTFLAVLELIRMRQLVVRQEEQFGDIWIEKRPLIASISAS